MTENLFLTGARGINYETVNLNGVTCIINTTLEVPLFQVAGVQCIRIPV